MVLYNNNMANIYKRLRNELCSRCDRPRSPSHCYCRRCKAAYMRTWRLTHPFNEDQRVKANCRAYTNTLQARGMLPKGPCEQCGNPTAQNHHPDYSDPRTFNRLCKSCHRRLHRTDRPEGATSLKLPPTTTSSQSS